MIFCIPCLGLLLYYAILAIFFPKYRKEVKLAFDCFWRKLTLRPCLQGFDQKMKNKATAKLMKYSPRLAKFVHNYFDIIMTIFTILTIVSIIYALYLGIHWFILYNSPCAGSNSTVCVG